MYYQFTSISLRPAPPSIKLKMPLTFPCFKADGTIEEVVLTLADDSPWEYPVKVDIKDIDENQETAK
jgi:hypothetical protein